MARAAAAAPQSTPAARFASGDLLLTVDADTVFEPTAVARLAAAFDDPRVGGASCNIAISNEREVDLDRAAKRRIPDVDQRRAIVLDVVGAIACLSGACSMYRRDVFLRQGGLDVGPGEDLEFSLRLRRLGYLIRFVPDAWAETDGPASGISLLRQRARWDRDALRVRFMMYGELRFFHRLERLPDTLQRLDFIVFDLVPTLSLPFYLAYVVLLFGAPTRRCSSAAIYVAAALDLDFQHGAGLRHVQPVASASFGLAAALIFPFYQGVYLKCARFFSYSSEIIFAASRHDDFVPPRVRRALFGRIGSRPMNVTINRLDPNVPDPVESRRRAAGRLVRIAYATIVFGMLAFFVIYFGRPLVYLERPRHRLLPARRGLAALYRAGQADERGCAAPRSRPATEIGRSGRRSRTTSSPPTCARWRTSPAAARSCGSRRGWRRTRWRPRAPICASPRRRWNASSRRRRRQR